MKKREIGLVEDIQLYENKDPRIISFHLKDIYPRVWERVIRPGVEDLVNLVSITTYRFNAYPTISLDIRVREKSP